MFSSSFWDEDGLSCKRLPTLQDLLACCDDARFVSVVMEERVRRAFADAPASTKRRRAAERKLKAALDTMRGLDVRRKANRSMILLPAESFVLHARSGLIERMVSGRLVSFECASAVRRALDEAASLKGGGAGRVQEVFSEVPQPAGYALAPWEDTLATRVWLGGSWCCRERYLVLSSAFWEMTYYGFEYDRVCANQARAKARLVSDACASVDPGSSASAEDPIGGETLPRGVARRAVWFGLEEPERFDEAYRERLIRCVGALNQAAQLDFWRRFEDLARKLGKG